MAEPDMFLPAVSFVFGMLAWAQMPAVCGFMLSSTRAGAGNYVYSIWLGALIAAIGLGSSMPALLRGRRHALLVAGILLSAGFIGWSLAAHDDYGAACHAVFAAFEPPG